MHYKHTRNNYSTQRAINRTLSLESLEDRRLLAFVPSTVIVADDAPARFVPSHPVVANGFRALTGEEAADFQVPDDMRLVQSYELPTYGLAYERYQQTLETADVLGGQLTIYKDGTGITTAVIGAHFPKIIATNEVELLAADAHRIVDREIPAPDHRKTDLLIDPASGRFFFQVESGSFDSRWFHWVDAANGRVLNQFDGLAHDDGIGVKGDTKSLAGLTTNHTTGKPSSRGYWLQSAGDRQVTYDGENNVNLYSVATLMIDSDNHWISPGQAAGVDAQYYANVVDDYFLDIHGRDSYDNAGAPMRSVVHAFSAGAFWRGSYVIYGDSSTSGNFGPSSGALDVVGHEWTHGVTEFTSGLINQDESGALNEAFSDIIGTSIEFYAEDHNLDPAATPDFWMGEDVDLRSDPEEVPGGRNLADPEEDGHPDHYSELVITTDDFGGVHTNNGIPNHAYYLLVNGGFNASCASPTDHNSAHCTGGVGDSTPVMPIGLTDAEQIFYLAFTGLSSTATMADARAATEATASSRFGPASQQLQSTIDAWITVGVGTIPTGGAPTANAGPDQTVGDGDGSGDAVVTLIGSGSDSDGTIVIYEWKEGTTVLGSTASISPVLTVGGHTLTLTVTDDEGFTGSDTVVVTVNANQAPTADAGPDQTVTDGDSSGDEQVTLNGSGSDSDGTIFGYEWKEGTTVIGTTEIISPTLAIGSHTLTLTVTDNGGETGTDTVVVTVSDGSVPTTKFFVADDDVDQTFEYDAGGTPGGTNWNLASGNTDPRGAASDGTGTQVWIVDSDKRVYVYDDDGVAQGSWSAKGGLKRPEGIASDGTDIWIVDTNSDKVLRYSGAAARTAGNQGSSGSFALAAANPTGITTDGTTIWVVDSGTDRFYEYDTVGGSLGDWPLVGGSSNPTGITIDPSGTSNDIWVVDNGSNSVSRYDRDTGSFIDSFALAVGNANPQGIADPPPRSQIGVEHDWIASRPVAGPLDFRPLNNTARARLLTKTTHVSNTTLPTFVESDTPSVAGLSAIWKATSKTRHGLMAHDQAIEDLADGELLANDFVEQLSHAFHRSQ